MNSLKGHKFVNQAAEDLLEKKDLKYLDLLQHLPDDHILKSISLSISKSAQLPSSSVFIAGLSVISTLLSRAYVTSYPDGSMIPLGIYAVVEQPSGTGKSRCLSTFQMPIWKAERDIRNAALKELAEIEGDEKPSKEDKKRIKELEAIIAKPSFFTSNATPEALEQSLNNTNGFFSLVSAEQGLFNSMFGKSYRSDGGSGNNNDLLLHGYMGEFFNSIRVGRSGYRGRATGGVCLFSQSGSVETLLEASGSIGMVERFLIIAEPHSIGNRIFRNVPVLDKNLVHHFDGLIGKITEKAFNSEQANVEELPSVVMSPAGVEILTNYKEWLEPFLRDDSELAVHPLIKGAGVKTDMAIYKIAAILHIMYQGANNAAMINPVIDDVFVSSAVNIVNTLLFSLKDLLHAKSIAGKSAEAECIIRIFENDNRPRTERQIITSRSQVKPFSELGKGKSKAIRNAISELVVAGLIHDISRNIGNENMACKTYTLCA